MLSSPNEEVALEMSDSSRLRIHLQKNFVGELRLKATAFAVDLDGKTSEGQAGKQIRIKGGIERIAERRLFPSKVANGL